MDSTIVIIKVYNECAQPYANVIVLFDLPELEILEMIFVGLNCDQTLAVCTNHERVRIKAKSMQIVVSCTGYRMENF